ncbi:MAG: tetratricopeptide repeat protein [Chthoniobacterales bacterium]
MVYGKPERARHYLRLLIKLRPSDSRLLRSLARSEMESGNSEQAKEILENSLKMSMDHQERAATFLLLSRVFVRLERSEDSFNAITEFLNLKKMFNLKS